MLISIYVSYVNSVHGGIILTIVIFIFTWKLFVERERERERKYREEEWRIEVQRNVT
jgi:hypothetical protein